MANRLDVPGTALEGPNPADRPVARGSAIGQACPETAPQLAPESPTELLTDTDPSFALFFDGRQAGTQIDGKVAAVGRGPHEPSARNDPATVWPCPGCGRMTEPETVCALCSAG